MSISSYARDPRTAHTRSFLGHQQREREITLSGHEEALPFAAPRAGVAARLGQFANSRSNRMLLFVVTSGLLTSWLIILLLDAAPAPLPSQTLSHAQVQASYPGAGR
jgi:hypothetical protein